MQFARRQPSPPSPEDRARFAGYAEYLQVHHPELSAYTQRRTAYWQSIRSNQGGRLEVRASRKLIAAWDRENPPPLSWEEQAEIRAKFLQTSASTG